MSDQIMMDKEASCEQCGGTGEITITGGSAKCPTCSGQGTTIIQSEMMNKASDDNLDNPMDKVAEDLHGKDGGEG